MAQLCEHLQMLYIICLLEMSAFTEFPKTWLNELNVTWKNATITEPVF